jgi:two-component system response regulator AlgR
VDQLRVLIVDDEPLARLRLRTLLEQSRDPSALVVGEAGDARQTLDLLRSQACDAVLLDIRMPGQDGLQLAAALRRLPQPPAVIFVTAHGEHALQAFDLDAVDYLTKPVQRQRLGSALQRAAQRSAAPGAGVGDRAPRGPAPRMLVIEERSRTLRIPLQEVVYARAGHKQVILQTLTREHVLDLALAGLEQRLGAGFIRVHRNAIVARTAVRELQRRAGLGGDDAWAVRITPGELWLPVSRRLLASVRQELGET